MATAKSQHDLELLTQTIRTRTIGLVDHEDVGNLHQPCLERLDRVAGLRDEDDDACIGRACDIELALADADRLDEDSIDTKGVEDVRHLAGCGREASERSASCHRPDEYPRVECDRLHPDS